MSSKFTDSSDPVLQSDVDQFQQPIMDLESGAAFYRVATGTGSPYVVDFTKAARPNGEGHYITTTAHDSERDLQPGQFIFFKANVNSIASSSLQVKLEDGSTGTNSSAIPLFAGDNQVGVDQIKQDQIVVAVYNDTTTPRFDIAGGPSAVSYQIYNRDSTSNQVINSTTWTDMTGCSGSLTVAGTTSQVILNAHHNIEAYPAKSTNRGQWRLELSKSGSTSVYLPSSTGQTQTSPYNLVASAAAGGTFKTSGLAAGTWTVKLQMQANSGNTYYGQTANTSASCTAAVINP